MGYPLPRAPGSVGRKPSGRGFPPSSARWVRTIRRVKVVDAGDEDDDDEDGDLTSLAFKQVGSRFGSSGTFCFA
jgi:hypothetical protein